MKKFFAVLLTLMLLAGLTGSALAYDGEITFQGIAWGSSFEDVMNGLNEKGFIDPDAPGSLQDQLSAGYGQYLVPDPDFTCNTSSEHDEVLASASLQRGWNLADGAKIAGYDVKEFLLTFVDHGGNTQLALVDIRLDYVNPKEAATDLARKLTAVYGDPVFANFSVLETTCWQGADQTVVYIFCLDGELMQLCYGTLNAENMVAEAVANYSAPANNVDSTDVGGL